MRIRHHAELPDPCASRNYSSEWEVQAPARSCAPSSCPPAEGPGRRHSGPAVKVWELICRLTVARWVAEAHRPKLMAGLAGGVTVNY